MHNTYRTVIGAAAAAFALAAPAGAATDITILGSDPAQTRVLNVAQAAKRTCAARVAEGARGTWTERFVAPADGTLVVRLQGASHSRDDWDVAIFDRAGTLRASGQSFGSSEYTDITLRKDAVVVLQVCRRKGADRTMPLQTQFTRLDLHRALTTKAPKISLVQVPVVSRMQYELLERLGLDITHDVRDGRANVLLHGDEQRGILEAAGFAVKTLISDMAAQEFADRQAERRYAQRVGANGSPLPTGRSDYREYDDYETELKALVEKNKGLVRALPSPGKTWLGRDLPVIEIAQDVERTDDGRPVFFLNGMHHAREWPSPEGILEFAHDLVNNNGKDPRITKILRDTRIVFMPFTNADGYIVSRAAPNPDPDGENVGAAYSTASGVVLFGGSLGYKRKNCNYTAVTTVVPSSAVPCEFALGVDNNRNYGESWGGPGASSNPNDQSYRGSGPFSEPESQAVRKQFLKLNATMMLTIHNVAALVLRPPGLKSEGLAPDEPQLKALGDAMAKATGYTSQYGWQLYDTTGTTDDYTYAASNGFGYTIEMGPSGGVFHGNYQTSVIDQYEGTGKLKGKGLREAYLLAAEAATKPEWTSRLTGRAPAGRTLHIVKEFKTHTFPVCQIAEPLPVGVAATGEDPTSCIGSGAVQELPEKIEFSTVVPANGRFTWWINPSLRPSAVKSNKKETYLLTCEDGGKVVEKAELFVARNEAAKIDLPCGGTLPPETEQAVAGVKVKVGAIVGRLRLINSRRRAVVLVRVTGGALTKARVQLLARRGSKVLGEARVAKLQNLQRVTLKLKRGVRLRRATYRLRISGTQAKGSTLRVTRTVKVSAR